MAALSGYMAAEGFTGDANDPAALVLFALNVAASHFGLHQIAVGAPLKMLVLCSLLSALCACSNTSRDAFTARLEAAAVTLSKDIGADVIQTTLQTLRSELARLEAKPVDDDLAQRVLDQNRISALKAAIQLGESKLAKLRGGKEPVKITAAEPQRAEFQRLEPQRVTIPVFAPRVVLLLRSVRA